VPEGPSSSDDPLTAAAALSKVNLKVLRTSIAREEKTEGHKKAKIPQAKIGPSFAGRPDCFSFERNRSSRLGHVAIDYRSHPRVASLSSGGRYQLLTAFA
jgi:hypothetical protein